MSQTWNLYYIISCIYTTTDPMAIDLCTVLVYVQKAVSPNSLTFFQFCCLYKLNHAYAQALSTANHVPQVYLQNFVAKNSKSKMASKMAAILTEFEMASNMASLATILTEFEILKERLDRDVGLPQIWCRMKGENFYKAIPFVCGDTVINGVKCLVKISFLIFNPLLTMWVCSIFARLDTEKVNMKVLV